MTEFKLNDKESKQLDKFTMKHYKRCQSDVSVTFVQTGIGSNIEAKCLACNKTKDITDYDSW